VAEAMHTDPDETSVKSSEDNVFIHAVSPKDKTNLNNSQHKFIKDRYTGTYTAMANTLCNQMNTVTAYYCDATLYFHVDVAYICANFASPKKLKGNLVPLTTFLASFNATEDRSPYSLFKEIMSWSNIKARWQLIDYVLRPSITEAAANFDEHFWELTSPMLKRLGCLKARPKEG
jgi:hypothetical protein